MHRVFILILIVMLGLGAAGSVLAGEEKANLAEKAGDQLAEGLKETVEGSVQIPAEMAEAAKDNPVKAVTVAPIEGAKETVLQTTEGAIHTATFFIPDSNQTSPVSSAPASASTSATE